MHVKQIQQRVTYVLEIDENSLYVQLLLCIASVPYHVTGYCPMQSPAVIESIEDWIASYILSM